MDISKRLQAVAGLVTRRSMADIGTDHGYVPLYLYEQRKIDKALACDLNKGPLEKAKENIAAMGAGDAIETRLGSGARTYRGSGKRRHCRYGRYAYLPHPQGKRSSGKKPERMDTFSSA